MRVHGSSNCNAVAASFEGKETAAPKPGEGFPWTSSNKAYQMVVLVASCYGSSGRYAISYCQEVALLSIHGHVWWYLWWWIETVWYGGGGTTIQVWYHLPYQPYHIVFFSSRLVVFCIRAQASRLFERSHFYELTVT